MDATVEQLLALYTQLRSTAGPQIEDVCRTLERMYTLEAAIHPLFEIILSCDLEPIFREHAIFGVCTWLRNLKNVIDAERLAFIKERTLSALINETNWKTRKALVGLVTNIIEEFNCQWRELMTAIINQTMAMDAVLPIVTVIVYRVKEEALLSHVDFLIGCVLSGFNSDNILVVSEAVILLVAMHNVLKSDEFFGECKQKLLEILFNAALSGDPKRFLSVASPIICAYDIDVNCAILPFQPLFEFFLNLVQKGNFEPEYTLRLHSFLCSTVLFHKSAAIPADVVGILFETEMRIGSMVLDLDDVDPTMNWLCDVDAMLIALFYRTPLDTIVELVKETVTRLLSIGTDQARCMVIVLLDNGMESASDAFIPAMWKIFRLVTDALADEGSLSQRLAARMLGHRSSELANEINANLPELCSVINSFMRNVDANAGSELLVTILDEVASTDLVFSVLVKTAFEMIQHPDCQVEYFGYIVLAKIIPRTDFAIVTDEFEHILKSMAELVGLETPNSAAFQVMAQLCVVEPGRFITAYPQAIEAAIEGLQSSDPYAIADVLRFVNKAIQIDFMRQFFLKHVEVLIPILFVVSEKEFSDEDSSASSYALMAIARLNAVVGSAEVMSAISQRLLSFIRNRLYIGAFKVFKICKGQFEDSVCRALIESAFEMLEVEDDNPFARTAAVDALCTAVANNRSLYGNEKRFVETMIAIVEHQVNPHTHEFQCDETIEAKIAKVLPDVVMKMNILVRDSFEFLMTMIRSNTVKSVFAFDTFAVLFQKYRQQISDDVQEALLSLVLPVIAEGQPRLAQAAGVFLPYAYKASFFKSHGQEILEALLTRLTKESSPSLLTDNLINAVTELGGQVLGDTFPFQNVLEVVLPLLPVSREFRVCNSIYSFLASAAKLGKTDERMLAAIMRVMVNVIAVPFDSLRKLERHVLNSFRAVLRGFFDMIPNAAEFVAASLENDAVKMENFRNSYMKLFQ